MSTRASAWLAWSLAVLSLVLCGAGIALYLATLSVQPPSSWGTGGLSAVLYVYLPFLAFPLVGALIASRRPHNPIGWISALPSASSGCSPSRAAPTRCTACGWPAPARSRSRPRSARWARSWRRRQQS